MAEHQPAPQPERVPEVVYLYRLDPETQLPVVVGKTFVDKDANAWVVINSTTLAAGLNVADIDGLSLMNDVDFQIWEPS